MFVCAEEIFLKLQVISGRQVTAQLKRSLRVTILRRYGPLEKTGTAASGLTPTLGTLWCVRR